MKRLFSLVVLVVVSIVVFSSCDCKHEWTEATCNTLSICTKCGEKRGGYADHIWAEATLSSPKTCTVCGLSVGSPLVIIPTTEGVDEETAKNLIISKNLIPRIEYIYDSENKYEKGYVIKTDPKVGATVNADTAVTIYVSKGFSYYEAYNSTGYINDVENIDPFEWYTDTDLGTKGFYAPYVKEGFLYIPVYIGCKSYYELEFENLTTASLTEYSTTIPAEIIYADKKIKNTGEITEFTFKISMNDLNNQNPSEIYLQANISVNGVRCPLNCGFSISW